MPTHQIHFARASGLPDAKTIAEAAKEHVAGQNDKSPYIIRDITAGKDFSANLIAQVDASIRVFDKDVGNVVARNIRKAIFFELAINSDKAWIVTQGGGRKTLDYATEFLIGDLALPVLWDRITLPVLETIDKLCNLCADTDGIDFLGTKKSTIGGYCHDSYMVGNYAAQFLDPVHGRDFMGEYENAVKSADVHLMVDGMSVTIRLAGDSSFSFTTKADADPRPIAEICRQLSGWKEK